MDTLIQDLRYGCRTLAKRPGFTALALITLALGLGTNTALFSVVNGVLLNPLPYPHPEQLVTLHESKPNFQTGAIPYLNFVDWQNENHTFSSIAISRGYSFTLTGLGESERLQGQWVSASFFHTLGVTPAIGRDFSLEDDQFGAAPVALISAALWKRRFGSSAHVLGKVMVLDGKGYTVIGVMPANFNLTVSSFQPGDVYAPIRQWDNPSLRNRKAALSLHGIGRMKPGVTLEQAKADLQRVARNLAAAYPEANAGTSANILPMKQNMVGHIQPYLMALLAAVGFVLLIACVNVANLLLARSTGRTREFAIRAALGASKGRVVQQLLVESSLLALSGGALGLALAAWGTQAALAKLPTALPRAGEISIDGRVLFFTVIVSLATGILFGLAPALKSARRDLNEALQQGGRGSSGARHRAHGALVALEMALALVLLIGAGLMIRSIARIWRVNPGFEPRNLLTFSVSLPPALKSASPAAHRAALRALEGRLQATPGVQAESLSWGAFPMNVEDDQLFWPDGQPKPQSASGMDWTLDYIVGPDYLNAMKIPLKQGRFLAEQDDERSPLVIVIDDVFANKFFRNENPVGKRVNLAAGDRKAEIVGVVGHANQWGLDSDEAQPLRAQMYLSLQQMPDDWFQGPTGADVVVRTLGSPDTVIGAIRQTIRQISGDSVVYGFETMDDIVSSSLATRQFSMILLGAFAALALILASIGLYGVVSYLVGQRTHEIGVRMALGARRDDVLRLVLGQGAEMALLGVGLGLVAAFGLTRLMAKFSLLFAVSALDPLTFAGVSVLLVLVALAACYVPAHRATRVDPMVALRCE
jgi:predicted permease